MKLFLLSSLLTWSAMLVVATGADIFTGFIGLVLMMTAGAVLAVAVQESRNP